MITKVSLVFHSRNEFGSDSPTEYSIKHTGKKIRSLHNCKYPGQPPNGQLRKKIDELKYHRETFINFCGHNF